MELLGSCRNSILRKELLLNWKKPHIVLVEILITEQPSYVCWNYLVYGEQY